MKVPSGQSRFNKMVWRPEAHWFIVQKFNIRWAFLLVASVPEALKLISINLNIQG